MRDCFNWIHWAKDSLVYAWLKCKVFYHFVHLLTNKSLTMPFISFQVFFSFTYCLIFSFCRLMWRIHVWLWVKTKAESFCILGITRINLRLSLHDDVIVFIKLIQKLCWHFIKQFFYKATLLQQVNDLLESISNEITTAHGIVEELETAIRPIEKELNELQVKIKTMEHVEQISIQVQELKKKLAWSWVYDVDKKLEEQNVKIEKLKNRIPTCQAKIDQQLVCKPTCLSHSEVSMSIECEVVFVVWEYCILLRILNMMQRLVYGIQWKLGISSGVCLCPFWQELLVPPILETYPRIGLYWQIVKCISWGINSEVCFDRAKCLINHSIVMCLVHFNW